MENQNFLHFHVNTDKKIVHPYPFAVIVSMENIARKGENIKQPANLKVESQKKKK